jgi:SPP1 family phage portal protein
MKEARQIFLDADGSVEFLLKQINDTASENYKTRIIQDLHKLSLTPNITDEQFSNNVSGIAMKYKLYGLEQKSSIKERKMKKGLQRRIELICNFLNISKNYDYLSVTMQFTRNFIDNFADIADGVVKIAPFISKSTLLGLLPFVEDVEYELEKIEQEQSEMQVNLFREVEDEEVIEDGEE